VPLGNTPARRRDARKCRIAKSVANAVNAVLKRLLRWPDTEFSAQAFLRKHFREST